MEEGGGGRNGRRVKEQKGKVYESRQRKNTDCVLKCKVSKENKLPP